MDTLGTVGEKSIVNSIIKNTHGKSFLGPGDDAAAIALGDKCIVVSTDIMSKRTHTSPEMSYFDIGWFAAAVNYSDIAAMGAEPIGILVAMMMERDLPYADFQEIMRGVQECSESVGAEILGGDTKEGAGIVIAGTALGAVNKNNILKRSGAKEGDLIAVTGPIGTAAAGLLAVQNDIDAPDVKRSLYAPFPRTKEGCIISQSGYATSCMDITDGLSFSLCEIAKQSGVHVEVDWSKIPVTNETKKIIGMTSADEMENVLYFGGEYELVFTFNPQGEEYLREKLGDMFHIIGCVHGQSNVLVKDGKKIMLEHRGWEHFRR